MEHQLIKTEQSYAALKFEDAMTMAKTFAESGMFADTKQAAQAFVKIQAGIEMGIPPFQAMSGVHIIQGKVTVGAGIMAAKVKGSGKYDYKVLQNDDKACSIDFYKGKDKLGNSTFTIDDARKAGTKNLDKFPRNMLFARAMSNGVKWYTPDVFTGPVYTPEEFEVEDQGYAQEVKTTPLNIEAKVETKPAVETGDNGLEKLRTEFRKVLGSATHVLEEKEITAAHQALEGWNAEMITKEMAGLKKVIKKREEAIMNQAQ